MAFPPGFLDDIRSRISLSGLVGRRVALKQRGRDDWWGLSPFTNEKTPSFHVREDKGFFHCFASGEHGDHFTWLMKTEGLSFPEAVERLAGDAGLEMPERTPEQKAAEQRRGGLIEAMEAATAFFQEELRKPAGQAALDYLRGRGLKAETIERFRLGFAPADGQALGRLLERQGFERRTLVEAGLMRDGRDGREPYAFFRDRIMFPITDRGGRVIAFGGRFMGDAKAAGVGKYINSPDTPLFDKGRTLYNFRDARAAAYEGQPLLVAEGYMDVITLAEAGLTAAIAPLGTAVTEAQIEAMWRAADEPVLCLDGDTAGRNAALRAAERALPVLKPGKSLRFAFLPPGEDPDTLVRGRGLQAMRSLIDNAEPLDAVIWASECARHPLDTPERRAALKKRLDGLTGQIADAGVRDQYSRTFRDRLWEMSRNRPDGRQRPAGRRGGGRAGGRFGGAERPPMAKRIGQMRPGLPRRQQQVLLAALVNHPRLIGEFLEVVAQVPFDSDLDKIWRHLQNVALSQADLDAAAVRHHFAAMGWDAMLAPVQQREIYMVARQARAEAADVDARDLIEHILTLRSQGALQRDLAAAGRDADGVSGEARIVAFHDTLSDGERKLFRPDDEG